jgi:4-hydroxy-tetrahydrodipicolinate synthase
LGKTPKELYQAVANGQLNDAQEIFYKQLPMLRFIVAGGIPKAIKAGLVKEGIAAGQPRKPLRGATKTEIHQLDTLMADFSR